MPIIPERLKELRKRKKLSREDLYDRSNITRRQIARLESETGAASTPRDRTINKLADALDVEPGVLTGEVPMPAAASTGPDPDVVDIPGMEVPRQVSAWISPEINSAYALIRRRYGVNLTTLVNAAPLMFVLLAESSFVWRRERLEEVDAAMEALGGLASGYRRFPGGVNHIDEGFVRERESIEKQDLFGEHVEERWAKGIPEYSLGHDPNACNPFADYLRELAEKIGDPDIVDIGEGEGTIKNDGPLKGFPLFSICDGDLKEITCGRIRFAAALKFGWLRINDMPEPLLASDASEEREEWLDWQIEEQCPPEFKTVLELAKSMDEKEGAAS